MKARCLNNVAHKRFVTVAHVAEDWIVDENGNFIEALGLPHETVADPNPGNIWTCHECNAQAIVE